MSLNKSKLTPESKRNVLEQFLQFVDHHAPDETDNDQSANDKSPPMLSFIKLMCVSKSFLIISCHSRFDIYRLSLEIKHHEHSDYDFQNIYINSNHYSIFDKYHAMSTVSDKLSKLLQFFKPPFIGLYIDKHVQLTEVEHIFEFLRKTDAKIGLFLNLNLKYDEEEEYYYCYLGSEGHRFDIQLSEFVRRINALECDVSYLDFETLLPLSLLESLTIKEIKNFDQIVQLLRYNTKSLGLDLHDDYFVGYFDRSDFDDISDEQLDLIKNTHVESLSLCFWKPFDSESFIINSLQLFPNLTNITIQILPGINELKINRIANELILYQEEMEDLKDRLFAAGLECVSISFSKSFYKRKQIYNNSWIEATRTKPEFADWNNETKCEEMWDRTGYSLCLSKEEKNCSLTIYVYVSVDDPQLNDYSNAYEWDDAVLEDIANLFV